jgi:hypothetical protein
VSDVVPLAVPTVAVMPAEPIPTPCERPAESIVATDGVSDDQAAVLVRSMIVESEYVPVAVNCWLAPFWIEGFEGPTVIISSSAGFTLRVVEPETALTVADIVVEPTPLLAASP